MKLLYARMLSMVGFWMALGFVIGSGAELNGFWMLALIIFTGETATWIITIQNNLNTKIEYVDVNKV